MGIFNLIFESMSSGEEQAEYERLCAICCQSVDAQEKSAAENFLGELIGTPENIPRVMSLLQNTTSDFCVFVTSELLGKLYTASMYKNLLFVLSEESKRGEIIGNRDVEIIRGLINGLLAFVSQNAERLKGYLLNSLCNTISLLIKAIWSEIETTESFLEAMFLELADKTLAHEFVLWKLQEYLLLNFTTLSASQSAFWLYRRLTYTFSKNGLPTIYAYTWATLKKVLGRVFEEGDREFLEKNEKQFETLVNVFQLALCYNFNLSYLDYDIDVTAFDLGIVCYPESYLKFMRDFDVFSLALKTYLLFLEKAPEISFKIIRGLNRWVSCRITLFETKEERLTFVNLCMEFAIAAMKNVAGINEELLKEVIDINTRMINNFEITKMRRMDTLFATWLQTTTVFSVEIIERTRQMSQNYINDIHELWKRISKQRMFKLPKLTPEIVGLISKCLSEVSASTYAHFLSNPIVLDSNFPKYKKFTKIFKNTFMNLSEIFMFNVEENITILEKGCDELLGSVQYNEGTLDIRLFESRLALTVGVLCQTVMINPSFELNLRDHFSKNPNDLMQQNSMANGQQSTQSVEIVKDYVGRIIAKLFEIVRIVSEQEKIFSPVLELSMLYFLESFVDCTVQGVEVSQDGSNLQCVAKIFQYANQFMGLEGNYYKLVEFILKKVVSNLNIHNRCVMEYSLELFKKILLRMKQHLPRDKFRKLPLTYYISNDLPNFSQTALASKDFFKLRTTFYEILSIIFVDDYFDDYISSLDRLFNNIIVTNNASDSLGLISLFRDSSGIASYLDITKIFKYFVKISYPTYSKLLIEVVSNSFDDVDVMSAALDFMIALSKNKAQRYSFDNNNIYPYKIFKDFSVIVVAYIQDLRQKVSTLSGNEQRLENYLHGRVKMIGKLTMLFKTFMDGKYLNFSVFHFFGDYTFVEYLRANIDINSIFYPILTYYPNRLIQVYENIMRISENVLEIMLVYLDHACLADLILISFNIIKKMDEVGELRDLQDDVLVSKFNVIIHNICCFCFEEMNIKAESDLKLKIDEFMMNYYKILKDIALYVLDICFSKDQRQRLFVLWCNTLFAILSLSDRIFDEVKSEFLQKYSNFSMEALQSISTAFDALYSDVEKLSLIHI
eukprot:TRINITY_DN987_c0_g1_i13.p1 TRINITY_DN987_c0_g1~~TRINITY_DN987_c0_g1_i13.p1  ORF type:complete len:1127 (-),score=233.71 TRINITY_DN987_c0_g1_i13:61-3441(-)